MVGDAPDKRGLALFDFDGTITARDSFILFLFYSQPWWRMLASTIVIGPIAALYWLKLLHADTAKKAVVRVVFSGMDSERYQALAQSFASERLPRLVRSEALERIAWHRHLGHRMIVVSASLEDYLRPWCAANEIELIASRVEIVDGRLSGCLKGENCSGAEKVRRIREIVRESDYDVIFAYGNSHGDIEMLKIAHKPCYRRF